MAHRFMEHGVCAKPVARCFPEDQEGLRQPEVRGQDCSGEAASAHWELRRPEGPMQILTMQQEDTELTEQEGEGQWPSPSAPLPPEPAEVVAAGTRESEPPYPGRTKPLRRSFCPFQHPVPRSRQG